MKLTADIELNLPSDARTGGCLTMPEVLRWRALHQAERTAFRFLQNGEEETTVMSYAELAESVESIAGFLQQQGLVGERVLILLPIGAEYVLAILGCMAAGAIPVPMAAPRPKRQCERLETIARDSLAKGVITSFALRDALATELDELTRHTNCSVFTIEECHSSNVWTPVTVDAQTLAYIQYTSGSTTAPRGVMVTHGNVLHNCQAIAAASQRDDADVVVSWLPFFHDMGLVGTLFCPLLYGYPLVFMPPEAFVMRPIRWLNLISKYRGTFSPAPNFAYDLCVQKISSEQRQSLDLSSWRVAFNGSERISDRSLNEFAKLFGPCGFSPQTMRPCYGLAEATLMVTCSTVDQPPRISQFRSSALALGTAVPVSDGTSLVSCGQPVESTEVVIVDPETRKLCPEGIVGEILISGPGVTAGYWNNQELTAELFEARIAD
ncbi:MAG: fatty acyl-AMP ligase, partial [Planctomycetota bacterium]|nr:fatty acyl-AMP ligase [Planctomycetota bacterium]